MDLHHLPFDSALQDIFNYAAPVLVGFESVGHLERPLNSKWFDVLETTRILLAHCTIHDLYRETMISTLANNLRNLYRLYDIDLSVKRFWENINDDNSCLIARDNGKIWVLLLKS